MCNIAGYVGSRPAAPVLIEMMRKQEGWGGGYYTGIATMHEGRIYYAKLTGDLDRLVAETKAAELPGNIGILHSRSPSGGGDEWAHPFVDDRGGCVRLAYVANGAVGCFSDRNRFVGETAQRLEESGYVFHSRTEQAVGNYPCLAGGGCAHMSDVMAQLIAEKIDDGMCAGDAMDSAFCEMPAEIVGLMLAVSEPDCIVWSRINMPMFVGFSDHGAYMATTPQAFPEDAGEETLLPACSGGRVYADRIEKKPYVLPPASVAPITPALMKEAYNTLESCLRGNVWTATQMIHAIQGLFEKADCNQVNALAYWVMNAFEKEGRLIVERETVTSAGTGLPAPVFRGRLRN